MPARMIREALLNSDRFLSLPDNTSRICYVACLLKADDRGNLEAAPGHLVRLWRDFGVDSTEKAAAIGQFLADQDLIRFYDAHGKRYVHVPRFGQRMRSFKRACPESPWCKNSEESDDCSLDCQQDAADSSKSPPKRREEKRSKDAHFVRFWSLYPRKVSKGRAFKAWLKLNPDEQLTEEILQAVSLATTSEDWQKERGKWIPYPATYLNDRRWEDEPADSPMKDVH